MGETCKFGKYMQSADNNNKTDIEWQVLEVGTDDVLLVSKNVLKFKPYHEVNISDINWQNSTIRSWLNGLGATENQQSIDYSTDNFIHEAFSAAEIAEIRDSSNAYPDSDMSGSSAGTSTEKVFLLSVSQINTFFTSNDARKVKPTAYAVSDYSASSYASTEQQHNANYRPWEPTACDDDTCSARYWTRTNLPGGNAASVKADGEIPTDTTLSMIYAIGIRPAMRINIAASSD